MATRTADDDSIGHCAERNGCGKPVRYRGRFLLTLSQVPMDVSVPESPPWRAFFFKKPTAEMAKHIKAYLE